MSIISKLKQVEREHLIVIEAIHRDIEKLRMEETKLKNALEVLKTNSLHISDECIQKLSGYEEEIRSMDERLRQEKMLLNYLHLNVLPDTLKNKIEYSSDLLLIVIATLLIDAVIFMLSFDEGIARIIGLPVLLIFPGYALLSIIFSRIEDLGIIERAAFSVVLSIAVLLLLSFAIDGAAVKASDLLLALTFCIFACCGIAFLRRNLKPSSFLVSIFRKESGEDRREV